MSLEPTYNERQVTRSISLLAAALSTFRLVLQGEPKTGPFLSRVNTLTRAIDIAILSVRPYVRPSVCDVPVSDENGLTYSHSFFTIR